MKAETGVMYLEAKEYQGLPATRQKLGARQGTHGPSQPLEGGNSANTSLLVCRLWENQFLLFKPPSLWYWMAALANQDRTPSPLWALGSQGSWARNPGWAGGCEVCSQYSMKGWKGIRSADSWSHWLFRCLVPGKVVSQLVIKALRSLCVCVCVCVCVCRGPRARRPTSQPKESADHLYCVIPNVWMSKVPTFHQYSW